MPEPKELISAEMLRKVFTTTRVQIGADNWPRYAAELNSALREVVAAREREWMKMFCDLTPGGSEFANDPKRCVAYAIGRINDLMDQLKRMHIEVEAREQAAAMEMLKAVDEAALAPAEWTDDYVAWCRYKFENERGTEIITCDSDAEGAFKVYRHSGLASHRAAPLSEEAWKALESANEMCRSAFQIAQREGVDTNWETFKNRLDESLKIQHQVMHPAQYNLSSPTEAPRQLTNLSTKQWKQVKEKVPVEGLGIAEPPAPGTSGETK